MGVTPPWFKSTLSAIFLIVNDLQGGRVSPLLFFRPRKPLGGQMVAYSQKTPRSSCSHGVLSLCGLTWRSPRDTTCARVSGRGGVSQQVCYIVLVDSSRPEPGSERAAQVMEGEVIQPRLVEGLFEYDHGLAPAPASPFRVEDEFVGSGILP